MTRFMALGLLGLSLAACGGKAQQADLNCLAAATLAGKARPANQDLPIMMAYYMGKLDANDPEGKWTTAAKAAQQEVGRQPAQFEALMVSCSEPLRQSLARQVNSIRDQPGRP